MDEVHNATNNSSAVDGNIIPEAPQREGAKISAGGVGHIPLPPPPPPLGLMGKPFVPNTQAQNGKTRKNSTSSTSSSSIYSPGMHN